MGQGGTQMPDSYEHRYHNLFQAMAASFWECDFFPVGDMLRELKRSGVTDFPAHFAAHPEFVRDMMRATRVVDVNDQSVALFGRGDKAELLTSVEPFWPETSNAVYAASVVAAVTGRPNYSAETKLRAIDGREFEVLFTACFPAETMNKGSLLIGVIDISERVRAQTMLERVQADFAHAARVSMLGELTASLAHEVNQPLAAIATNAAAGLRWLGRPEPDVQEVRSITERIAADARRAADIIARVRDMAERRAPEPTLLSLNGVVEEAMLFLRHEVQGHGIEVASDLAPNLAPVLADRTQLQQVVVNLAVNAMQAMAAGPGPHVLTLQTGEAGDGVILRIEDNGPGVPEESLDRLFDSFFSTKSGGMGMGLPICRAILESHGGTIMASNRDFGPGAAFEVVLPAARD